MMICLPGLQYILPLHCIHYVFCVSSPFVLLLSLDTMHCSATLPQCQSREIGQNSFDGRGVADFGNGIISADSH